MGYGLGDCIGAKVGCPEKICINIAGDGLIGNIQLYAKEIENDTANVDAILDGAFTERAMTDGNLLALLATG